MCSKTVDVSTANIKMVVYKALISENACIAPRFGFLHILSFSRLFHDDNHFGNYQSNMVNEAARSVLLIHVQFPYRAVMEIWDITYWNLAWFFSQTSQPRPWYTIISINPLNELTQSRILYLQQIELEYSISCTIFPLSVAAAVSQEALSYSWGDPTFDALNFTWRWGCTYSYESTFGSELASFV